MEKRYGTIRVTLNKVVEKSGLSRTKVIHRAEMQPTQFNKYYFNTVTRLDTDVLARLCTVLNCQISDLLEFVPAENDDDIQKRPAP